MLHVFPILEKPGQFVMGLMCNLQRGEFWSFKHFTFSPGQIGEANGNNLFKKACVGREGLEIKKSDSL